MALTRSLKVYNGSDGVPVTDVTDRTDWTGTELSGLANLGEASASEWLMRDEGGTIPDFLGAGELVDSHNVIIATVGSNTLFRGRIAADDHFRGRQKAARAKEISFTLEDQNSHLRGIVVHSWVRPAETDAARAQALVAAYLSGSPRPTTNLNGSNLIITGSNAIALPAKTYSGVTPYEVMQELSSNADKEMFVSVDNELAYFGHDYTGYASGLRISDAGYPGGPDESSTTYVPWGPHGAEFGRQKLSALRVYYGSDVTQSTIRLTNSQAPRFDYWEDIFWDSESVTATQAEARAQKTLDYRSTDDVSYNCTIGPMSGDEIWKIKPGQSISFKSRAARGGRNANGSYTGDTFLTTRLRQINWTMPNEDQYVARVELERPKRTMPVGSGSQALATMPKGAPESIPDIAGSAIATWDFNTGTYPDFDNQTGLIAAFLDLESGVNCPGGGQCARNTASKRGTDHIAVTAATNYTFTADLRYLFDPSVRNIEADWYNSVGTNFATDILVVGAGHVEHTDYHEVALVTAPTGAVTVKIQFSAFAGIFVDNMVWGGTGTTAVNDPYALTASGDSPYFMKSDDPRVLGLLDRMETVGFAWKMPVRAATTIAGTLASSFENGDTLDGVVLATDDRILIKDQAAGADNGIYTVNATGAPTRADDFVSDEQVLGAAAFVSEGTTNGNKVYVCTTDAPIELGTTAFVFAAISGGGSVATDTIWDAKGDLAAGTAADTAAKLTVGANDTILMADSAQSTGLKWVAPATPSTQAFGDTAAAGTADTFSRGDHEHGMPVDPFVDGASAKASGSGDVTTTATAADATGATLSLTAGTYIVTGVFDVTRNGVTNDRAFEGVLDVGGTDENDLAPWTPLGAVIAHALVTQVWRVVLASTTTVKLQARHSGGTVGDFTVNGANTTITAYMAGSGAPSTADYLVGTTDGGLSGEIVVGTTPGGELGGTWASPTVDATHSGSAHHAQLHNHSAAGDGQALVPTSLTVTNAAGDATMRAISAVSPNRSYSSLRQSGDTDDRLGMASGSPADLGGVLTFGPGNAVTDVFLRRAGAKVLQLGSSAFSGTDLLLRYGGTSFPAGPATNDQFYRTDLGMWFFYDGTRWLTTVLYETTLPFVNDLATSLGDPASATPTPSFRGGSDIWLVAANLSGFFVKVGGSALSASHSWKVHIDGTGSTGAIEYTLFTINSGNSNQWREGTPGPVAAVGALLGTTRSYFYLYLEKTGTPGNLSCAVSITYRIVAT